MRQERTGARKESEDNDEKRGKSNHTISPSLSEYSETEFLVAFVRYFRTMTDETAQINCGKFMTSLESPSPKRTVNPGPITDAMDDFSMSLVRSEVTRVYILQDEEDDTSGVHGIPRMEPIGSANAQYETISLSSSLIDHQPKESPLR